MKLGKVVAAVALACSGASAYAGFDFSYTVESGTGVLAGSNILRFYARNDQQGGQVGTKSIVVFDAHYKPLTQSLIFEFADVNHTGTVVTNVYGVGMDESTIRGSFMRIGTTADWLGFSASPVGNANAANNVTPSAYANVTDFEVIGFSQNKQLDATQGRGQFFGAAVIPVGVAGVNVFGRVAAESGPATGSAVFGDVPGDEPAAAGPVAAGSPNVDFNFIAYVPEPGTLGLLGAGCAIGLRRRRRA